MAFRLHAGAEDRQHRGILAREQLRRHRGHGRGADRGDRRRIHDRQRRAGLAAVKDHRAEMRVQSAFRILGKNADFLERVVRRAPRRHEAEESRCARRANCVPQRVVHLAAGERGERVFHRRDALLHREELFDVMLIQNE